MEATVGPSAGGAFPQICSCLPLRSCSVDRLDNANTVFCNRGGSSTNRFAIVQIIEITPDKKVVWAVRDWNALGPATGIQLLDQSGIPETPGDLQR